MFFSAFYGGRIVPLWSGFDALTAIESRAVCIILGSGKGHIPLGMIRECRGFTFDKSLFIRGLSLNERVHIAWSK